MAMLSFAGRGRVGSLFLLFAVLVAGCNRSPLGEQAEVSGTVFYKGKPLPGGQITFVNAKGYPVVTIIDPQGRYQCQAPVGEVRIAVENRMLVKKTPSQPILVLEGLPKPKEESISGTYVPLPEKYRSPDESGLKYTVKSGAQTYDIKLPE